MSVEVHSSGQCVIEGTSYPAIGFGTYQLLGNACYEAVCQAAQIGYRIIDTATAYENHEPIGRALESLGRESYYVISKVWHDSQTEEGILRDIDSTLAALRTNYLDAYLLHWPNSTIPIEESLGAMDALRREGIIRHIGLSNVSCNHLRRALEVGVPISWVQIEMHPHFVDLPLLEACASHGIAIQAWRPVMYGKAATDPLLTKIGAQHGKSAIEVALRWILQHGCLPLPKSGTVSHIQENFDIFGFTISDAEMLEIDRVASVGQRRRFIVADEMGFRDEFDFSYEQCWPS
jgi:diketogulonate reductase-like aldo/keto reductase